MTMTSLDAAAAQWSRQSLFLRALSGWRRIGSLAYGRVNSSVRRMWAVRVGFYRSMWRTACEATGTNFSISAKGEIEMRRDGRCLKARDNETYLDDAVAIRRSGDKIFAHRLLTAAGIPTPRHVVFKIDEFERAFSYLQSIGPPVVVKPMAFTGGGFGVTTNIFTARQLRAAMASAHMFGENILMEQQIEGDVFRILLMDGVCLDSILRRPPTVVGDGKSTIRRLLRKENRRRVEEGAQRSQSIIAPDQDLINTLARQGFTMSSRPRAGSVIRLKQAINENAIQENEPASGLLSPEIVTAAVRAANLVGVRLAGVDVICRDPSLPLAKGGGVVLEVNAPPNLYYHSRDGRDVSVARAILDAYFAPASIVDAKSAARECGGSSSSGGVAYVQD